MEGARRSELEESTCKALCQTLAPLTDGIANLVAASLEFSAHFVPSLFLSMPLRMMSKVQPVLTAPTEVLTEIWMHPSRDIHKQA